MMNMTHNTLEAPLQAAPVARLRGLEGSTGLRFEDSALDRLFGAPAGEWLPSGPSPFSLVRVPQDTTLFHEGASARCVYLVQAGYFKTVRTGEDGYEQVLGFAGRHDLLGCDSLADGRYASAAVALEESWVHALPVAELHRLCQRLPLFNERWQSRMAEQIARVGETAWLMTAVGAEKRVARFVSLYARHKAASGESTRRFRLRMSRRDVASHLGLAHESVSRSFSMLAEEGILRVNNREIEILDGAALQALAYNTRGHADAPCRRGQRTAAVPRRSDVGSGAMPMAA